MRILAVGDVIARPGGVYGAGCGRDSRRRYGLSLCIVKGQTAAGGRGINRESYELLMDAGADVITLGNHTWDNREVISLFDDGCSLVRPANYPPSAHGNGYLVYDMGKYCVCVISLMGRVGMDALDCPFRTADRILEECGCKMVVVDFHAEATSEKQAMGYYLDGRVSAVFGTHTHVQTADERILPGGTGYLTDVGMTGVIQSVIGMKVENSVARFVTKTPHRYEVALGAVMFNGILFDVDPETGHTTGIERLFIRE